MSKRFAQMRECMIAQDAPMTAEELFNKLSGVEWALNINLIRAYLSLGKNKFWIICGAEKNNYATNKVRVVNYYKTFEPPKE